MMKSGFTLLECLVALAVLAVSLAAILEGQAWALKMETAVRARERARREISRVTAALRLGAEPAGIPAGSGPEVQLMWAPAAGGAGGWLRWLAVPCVRPAATIEFYTLNATNAPAP